jgi:GTPase
LAASLSGLLKSAFVSIPHFKWQNIAFLDTPGYSKAEVLSCEKKSDSSIAIAQLNSAKFIIWLVSAEEGTVSEADLVCLSQLNPDIPKLIVISKIDKKTPDDIEKILALVRSTLDNRGIRVLDVVSVSTRKKNNTMLSTLTAWINQWDKDQRESQLPYAFKRLFLIYQDYLEEKKRIAYYKLDQINSLLVMSDNDDVADKASILRDLINSELNQYKARVDDLDGFSHQFFSLLREIGECIDVPLNEPSSASMLNLTKLDLISIFDKAYSNDLDLKMNAFNQVCEKQFMHSNDKLLKKINNHACLYESLEKVSKEACLKLTRSSYYFHHDWQCSNKKVLSSADKLLRYQTYPGFYALPANKDNDYLLRKTDMLKIF